MQSALRVAQAEPDAARAATAEILASVPEWFGRPEATANYVEGSATRLTLLAHRQGEVAGVLTLQPHFADTLEVWLLAVHRSHHRAGIGARLLAAAEAEARQQGRRWLMLNTVGPETEDTYYAVTRAFYAAQGFTPLLDAGTDGRDVQTIWMIRALEALAP